jgi:dolichyl-phosphate beta-glucosyltransferase
MPDVCLVVPCYNEARRLPQDAILEFLSAHADCHVLFVDDGSSDGTAAVLTDLGRRCPEQVTSVTLTANSGKAEAVRRGALAAAAAGRYAYVGYWDADLSTPLSEVAMLVAVLNEQPDCLLALGSRWKRLGSRIERSTIRHVLGRVFASMASVVLNLPVYDSQCGAKIFRANAIDLLFADAFSSRWLFDVELLARMSNALGRKAMASAAVEVPLRQWRDISGSKLGIGSMVRVPLELLRIHRRYTHG